MSDEHKVTDPREMRQRLDEIARGVPFSTEGRAPALNICGAIVRNVRDMAQIAGYSGEDRYTALAWHLLHHASRMEQAVLQQVALAPRLGIISESAYQREQQEKNRKARDLVGGLPTKEDLDDAMRRNGADASNRAELLALLRREDPSFIGITYRNPA